MKAVMFDMNTLKVSLKFIHLAPKFALLKYKTDWPIPEIKFDNQIIVRNNLAGLCASDLHQYNLDISMYQSILANPKKIFPIGHEVVGTVSQMGPNAEAEDRIKVGDRVVYYPLPTCASYGFDLCPSCQTGNFQLCLCLAGVGDGTEREKKFGGEGKFGGFGGGGFSEYLVGFENQFFKVPDVIPDHVAVLTEPFSVGLHAVLRHPPQNSDTVMVIGGGIIGLMTIMALRSIKSKCRIIVVAKYPYQGDHAKNLGADEVILIKDSQQYYNKVIELTNAQHFEPIFSKTVIYGRGGPDVIYDCIASERSMDDNLRLIKCLGKIIIVGLGYSITKKVDWAIQIHKEVEIVGSFIHSMETW
ncbi:MAG: zinc-dependent alcohol dehydrogenase, partial [Promethearchaeota archaeon]